jgi:uncharacterized damage-inducible protein DinB
VTQLKNIVMTLIQMLLKEMDMEAVTTRKMLALVPVDKFDWKPHPKSMTMKALAVHIAEIPAWVSLVLHTTEIDFEAQPYQPILVTTNIELLNLLEKSVAEAKSALQKASEKSFDETWTIRMGKTILGSDSKAESIRHAYCQTVHHRAQLGVYLRLLDIPIPGSYGPSADEGSFAPSPSFD